MFYNTNSLTGSQYIQAVRNAKNQDEKVMLYLTYSENRVKEFTAGHLWKYSNLFDNTPLTSVRRSVNTLLNEGFIEYTGKKQKGLFGSPERIYKLTLPINDKN